MPKVINKTSNKRTPGSKSQRNILVQICWDDFQQQDDGSWITNREITIDGPGGTDRLVKAGRVFKRGELSIIGIDLAALLEKHLARPLDLNLRKTWHFK